MRKNKLLLLLALLLTAATGAWAQESATTYSVKMKDDVKDADKWTVKVGEGEAQALPIDGLKGDGSETVTLTYTGRLKVKGVKATSDAAASVPDGALSGVFSVSATKKVNFSKGNLRYASSKWSFFDNQYDYYESHSADAWDHFGWSTSATTYGMNTSTDNSDYSGDFVDWGATMGTGWFTLNKDEWTYLFNTRTVNGGTGSGKSYTKGQSVDGKLGVVIYPDNYTGDVYSGSDWATFESAGCVFLPAAGYRYGSPLSSPGTKGYYWSATPNGTNMAYSVLFTSGALSPAYSFGRRYGCSVRLVREVATSDAAAAGNIVDLSTLTADYEAQDGDVLTSTLGGNYKITIADGATVTLSGAVINGTNDSSYKWAGLSLAGDGTIILSGENSVKGFYEDYPGISVPENKTLTIQGDGSLTASSNGWGAGIGGVKEVACGNITISGGTVTATGEQYCAGIGGGSNASCGIITISGGTVIAIGGKYAAGIGGGNNASWGNITISGGTVTATGGERGAGIGGGRKGSSGSVTSGNILISGGTVTATGGEYAAGIGGGRGYNSGNLSSCGTITITTGVTKVTATMGDGATNSIGAGKYCTCGTVTIGGNVGAMTESPYTYQPSN